MTKIFCPEPFHYCEINPNGDVFVCCVAWCKNYAIGNLFEESLYEIWNSTKKGKKNKFVQQFIKQKFKHCSPDICLHQRQVPDDDFEKLFNHYRNENKLKRLRFNYDSTCNIKCIFCRDKYISVSKKESKEIEKINKEIINTLPYLNECHTTISFCGVGEFFCSKVHTDLIAEIVANYPNIKFSFVTNGVLCSEENLKKLQVEDRLEILEVSVNAFSEKTYNQICIGGDFNKVKNNLEYISKLKKSNKLDMFFMNFVITSKNYTEMPDFINWAFELGATPQFLTLMDFGNYTNDKLFEKLNISNPEHKDYPKFVKMLSNPVFRDKRVNIPQQYIDISLS